MPTQKCHSADCTPHCTCCVAGVVEIHQAGEALFHSVGTKVRDTNAKAVATNLGLKCFPDGLDGLQPLVCVHCPTYLLHNIIYQLLTTSTLFAQECRRKSLRELFWKSNPEQGYSALPTC